MICCVVVINCGCTAIDDNYDLGTKNSLQFMTHLLRAGSDNAEKRAGGTRAGNVVCSSRVGGRIAKRKTRKIRTLVCLFLRRGGRYLINVSRWRYWVLTKNFFLTSK